VNTSLSRSARGPLADDYDSPPPFARCALVAGVLGAHVLGAWALLQVESVRQAVGEVAPLVVDLIAPPTPPAPPPPTPPAPPKIVKHQPPPPPALAAAPSPSPDPPAFVAAPPTAEPPPPAAVEPPSPPPAPPAPPAPPPPPPPKSIPATAVG
jgi:protein TonB